MILVYKSVRQTLQDVLQDSAINLAISKYLDLVFIRFREIPSFA